MRINQKYRMLQESYLFSSIQKKVSTYQEKNPSAEIIRLGIGDVTRPLCPAAIAAMHKAVDEMAEAATFRGYGPEQGYDFLRTKIQQYYQKKNVRLSLEEIFISDGAKSDLGNILDLFAKENRVLIPSPVYPVYVDTNLMDGREIVYMEASKDNGFLPMPCEDVKADIIYLCSPNNPTGAVYTRVQLQKWVDYAIRQDAVLLFDAAYEAFITDSGCPKSIYEIEGAEACAIEFCSLSKTAGFTGTRCGYTIVPSALKRDGDCLQKMWLRRQTTKFNGVPYIVQRGAEAVFSEEGMAQCRDNIKQYQKNAQVIAKTLDMLGIWYVGGENSPYIWMECPNGMSSWEFFDDLLERANVVGTPGIGFGENGDGFFRLTAFGTQEATQMAMERLKEVYGK